MFESSICRKVVFQDVSLLLLRTILESTTQLEQNLIKLPNYTVLVRKEKRVLAIAFWVVNLLFKKNIIDIRMVHTFLVFLSYAFSFEVTFHVTSWLTRTLITGPPVVWVVGAQRWEDLIPRGVPWRLGRVHLAWPWEWKGFFESENTWVDSLIGCI